MTEDIAYDVIAAEMPEIEQLALLSVCDGGPISDYLTSKLYGRKLIRAVKRGTALSPRIEREPTTLGSAVACAIRLNRTQETPTDG